MSTTLTKEQKARARSFVAGLKRLKKALGLETTTEFAVMVGQPSTTVKGWLKNSLPTEEKMLAVDNHLLLKVDRIQSEAGAIQDFFAQA